MDKWSCGATSTAGVEYWGPSAPTIERRERPLSAGPAGERSVGTNTVTTTILVGGPELVNEPSAGTPSPWHHVRLRAWMPSTMAYLLIAADDDGTGPSFHRMDEVGLGRWSLTLRLKSGSYRYRYYTDQIALDSDVAPGTSDTAVACLNAGDGRITVPSGNLPADGSCSDSLTSPFVS